MFWYLILELFVEVIKAWCGCQNECHRSGGNCGGDSVVLRGADRGWCH